jgi:hypothetical protein
MWKRRDDGQFWPDPKRSISIRARELPDLTDGAAARRAFSLRYTRWDKRIFYKGAWVSAWLDESAAPLTDPRRRAALGREADHA